MRKELVEQFNREVDNYRTTLLSCAKRRDWKTFEVKAGRLFDYVESVEYRELERRFFRIFNLILSVLILAIIGFMAVDFNVHQELLRFKNPFILTAVAVSSFELYFYLDYRMFAESKTVDYRKRRENFIRAIEHDFRSYTTQAECKAA